MDEVGFRIPRVGFRIPVTGFRIQKLRIPDSGFQRQKNVGFRISDSLTWGDPGPPKALVRSINQLKKRDDIVISRPDKG